MGVALLVVAVLVIGIWVVIEVKRIKHKLFAMFLIGLILFLYISMVFVFKGQDIDYKTVSGVGYAAKLYMSWLGSVAGNFKSMTSHAVKMDWSGNETGS